MLLKSLLFKDMNWEISYSKCNSKINISSSHYSVRMLSSGKKVLILLKQILFSQFHPHTSFNMGHSISNWMWGVTLSFRISLFSYILLLFENDDQRKKIFLISHTVLKLWPVEIFTTRWRFIMRALFLLIGQCKFACIFANTLHRCTKIGFRVF